MVHTLEVKTTKSTELIDITAAIQELLSKHGPLDGVCYVYVPHTTAGVTINENADPSVKGDILLVLNKLIRDDEPYRHGEGNSPAHIKASLTGAAATVLVDSGRLVLGTWQGVFFCEYDGPRRRQVKVNFLKG
ncbi:MAG: YjbQ family protein [Deltaproteobacteria bacterium]|nr:YjbQ family protein [Deltaproteobacteria bacterium]